MAQVTIYQSKKSVSTDHNVVTEKTAEFIRDLKDLTPPMQLLNLQMVAGRIYVHTTEALSQELLDYYDLDKVN